MISADVTVHYLKQADPGDIGLTFTVWVAVAAAWSGFTFCLNGTEKQACSCVGVRLYNKATEEEVGNE